MNPNNDLKDAIQTGLVNPIKESFAKEREALKSIDKKIHVLIIIVVFNVIITIGMLGVMVIHS